MKTAEEPTDFEKMAVVIGHHFWDCEDDQRAYEMGKDCALEIQRVIIT